MTVEAATPDQKLSLFVLCQAESEGSELCLRSHKLRQSRGRRVADRVLLFHSNSVSLSGTSIMRATGGGMGSRWRVHEVPERGKGLSVVVVQEEDPCKLEDATVLHEMREG